MNSSDPLSKHFRITSRQAHSLARLDIVTVRDLLFYFPSRYETSYDFKKIADLTPGNRALIFGEVVKIGAGKTWKKRIRIAEAIIKDDTGLLRVVWFNQPYITRMIPPGSQVTISGKVAKSKGKIYFANPLFEKAISHPTPLPHEETGDRSLMPVYSETYGITSRWISFHVKKILDNMPQQEEIIPEVVLKAYRLPKIFTALRAIHFPKSPGEAEAARKRFSFEEIFVIQLARQRERKIFERSRPFKIDNPKELTEEFIASLPFTLTDAQKNTLHDILTDFKKNRPMARLLEGDVGSGKTVVAAAAALAAIKAGYQTLFMAPTEILTLQHFEEFAKRLGPFRVAIGLLTSSESRKFPSKVNPKASTKISKNQLLKWVESGDIKILIGTHSLIENRVKFKKLGFVVVDEQHRFGTLQRRRALKADTVGPLPHFLSMTATPIPRTLALTMYADLDLSLIDEMPAGRKPVTTKIVTAEERGKTYNFIRDEVKRGGQVFVVCPRIEETSNNQQSMTFYQQRMGWDDVKSVKAEYKKLTEHIFPELKVGMIHGQLKPQEKETIIKQFREGKLDILVSTSVIEVGVDIPGASIMMIEGAERFGLAQLHQLRGRVGRRGQDAYCFVFTTDGSESRRLKALEETKNGFELAEYDLQFRGPGELAGNHQWGFSDLGMEALKNIKMVEAARVEAEKIISEDFELQKYPLLKKRTSALGTPHFE